MYAGSGSASDEPEAPWHTTHRLGGQLARWVYRRRTIHDSTVLMADSCANEASKRKAAAHAAINEPLPKKKPVLGARAKSKGTPRCRGPSVLGTYGADAEGQAAAWGKSRQQDNGKNNGQGRGTGLCQGGTSAKTEADIEADREAYIDAAKLEADETADHCHGLPLPSDKGFNIPHVRGPLFKLDPENVAIFMDHQTRKRTYLKPCNILESCRLTDTESPGSRCATDGCSRPRQYEEGCAWDRCCKRGLCTDCHAHEPECDERTRVRDARVPEEGRQNPPRARRTWVVTPEQAAAAATALTSWIREEATEEPLSEEPCCANPGCNRARQYETGCQWDCCCKRGSMTDCQQHEPECDEKARVEDARALKESRQSPPEVQGTTSTAARN